MACGTELRANARFCDVCGSAVAESRGLAEYKQVTVLFADVVHSMDVAAAVGTERLRDIMTELLNLSSKIVQRYGGTVDKFTGDGVMAVFGAPRALEDHALRACMAALDIQQEVERLTVDVQERDGVAFHLRVGLNSGEVIAGDMGSGPSSYTSIGEQVGMAQRMESVAPLGGVMLSESTARLVESTAVLGEVESVQIKGAERPVTARLLISTSEGRHPSRQLSTLVGRAWEVSTVAGVLEQAIAGKGRIVTLVGPPGIGKSRMVAETNSIAASRGVEVFTTYCESHTSDIPFHVLARLLRDVFAVGDLGDDAARRAIRTRLSGADPADLVLLEDLIGIRAPDVALPDIDSDARRRRLAALLYSAAAARSTPAVYVIEDAHWIDDVSEAMLAELGGVIPQSRALLLITYRPDYHGKLDRLGSSHRIALAPLDDSEAIALASELLGSNPSVETLVAQISERAAGNPFFAEEIVRDLAEREVINGQPGAYVCQPDSTDVQVPASLQATIAARIDRVSPAAKQTLNACAVAGLRFEANLLTELTDISGIAELVAAELVDQVVFTPSVEYAFRHPLIRTVAYESQLKSDRSELHRRLADALKGSGESHAALVAEHLEAAGDFRDAFDWHMRAGNWSQARDIRAAKTSWLRAREVADRMPGDGPAEIDMRIQPRILLSINTLRFGGSVEETGFEELRELCAANGDVLSLALGLGGTVVMLVFHYRFAEAAGRASDLVDLLTGISDPAMTLSLWGAAANAKIQVGQVIEGMRLAQHGIDLAERDPTLDDVFSSSAALTFSLRAVSRFALGVRGWREDIERAIEMSRPPEPAHIAALVYKFAAITCNGGIQPDAAAMTQTAHALQTAERSGDDFALDSARLCRGITLVAGDGSYRTEGLESLAGYREASLRHGYSRNSVRWVDEEMAREKARLGDVDGAIELARKTVDFLYSVGDVLTRGPAVTTLVESLLARGDTPDVAEAEAAVDRLASVPTDLGFVLFELPMLRMRALLARARGDEVGYRGFAERYRTMANDLSFEGHMAIAAQM
jgi:adenylate cyclase